MTEVITFIKRHISGESTNQTHMSDITCCVTFHCALVRKGSPLFLSTEPHLGMAMLGLAVVWLWNANRKSTNKQGEHNKFW